jgi:beta-lactamase class A
MDPPPVALHTRAVTVDAAVREVLAGRDGTWAVYGRNLGTGETVEIDADVAMPAQSSLKAGVLVVFERRVDDGSIDPDRRIEMRDGDRESGSGVLRHLAAGLEPTLNDLAWLMTIVSDNVATEMLMRELGGAAAVDAELDRIGLPTARTNDPLPGTFAHFRSSPRDLAELYTHLGARSREMLYQQQTLDFLARRVPHDPNLADHGLTPPVRFFGKAGWGGNELVDAARFETADAAWVVAAMAKDLPDFRHRADFVGPRTLADVGELLWREWGGGVAEWT